MADLISVIVPVYDVEAYLSECVDSILGQSYADLEVILIDDGSPDRCGEVCDAYALRDNRVRVIHQENQGLSAARNAGLDTMTGRYVTFVDSDDWLNHECIERLHDLLSRAGADISVCTLHRTLGEVAVPKPQTMEVIELSRKVAIDQIVKPRYGSMVAACGKLYKAEMFSDVRFPVGRLHEDAFTTYRVILKCDSIILTTEPLYFYRQRPDSIMGSPFKAAAKLDIIDALIERGEALREAGMERAARTTYGQVLSTYMEIVQHSATGLVESSPPRTNVRVLLRRLMALNQPTKFKAFYALRSWVPTVADRLYERMARD